MPLIPNVIPMKIGIQISSSNAMIKQISPTVYILASRRNGTLYIGVTGNLPRRMAEHAQGLVAGFTKKYGVKTLVYYDRCSDMQEAIEREKQLKEWQRGWKIILIEDMNPNWLNLYHEQTGEILPGPSEGDRLTSEPVRDFE